MSPDRLAEINAAFAAHIAEHPAITYVEQTADGRPRTISDFLGVEEFHATPLYREFYSLPEITVEDQLSLTLPQPEMIIGIALNRSQRDFTTRDRLVLNLLRPHIVQALRNSAAFERSQMIITSLEGAVESGQDGLVLVSGDGRIEHLTRRARELLGEFFPTWKGPDLPPVLAEWAASADRPQAPEWPLVAERDSRHLLARRIPGDRAQVVMLSLAPKQPDAEDLLRLGLTGRQAEVMALVSRGHSTKEVAAALYISPRTVDKHVEQALRTLGATTRLQAVNLIRQAEWRGQDQPPTGGPGPSPDR